MHKSLVRFGLAKKSEVRLGSGSAKNSWFGRFLIGIPFMSGEVDWLLSFRRVDRSQKYVYDSPDSLSETLHCGIPKSSLLGPLLFILYINVISRAIFLALKNTFVSRDHHVTSTL